MKARLTFRDFVYDFLLGQNPYHSLTIDSLLPGDLPVGFTVDVTREPLPGPGTAQVV